MFTITKCFTFEAAHQLTKVPDGHKCRRLHGHHYQVTIELRAADLDGCGFVLDYGDLDALKTYLDASFDHRYLNDVLEIEPTAENLAWVLYTWAARRWRATSAVRVAETHGTTAEYRP